MDDFDHMTHFQPISEQECMNYVYDTLNRGAIFKAWRYYLRLQSTIYGLEVVSAE